LRVKRDDLGRPHLEAKYKHWRPSGAWQNEQEFSDGTLRLIGLLWAINEGTTPLLLEEPELSLHRDIVRQIPRMMAAATERSGRQVIVSTHAEEMLADTGIDPSEVLLLKPGEHATGVEVGSSVETLVRAAQARQPFGRIVTGLTRPAGVEQLALPLGFTSRRLPRGRTAQ
jgi:predicted ATPase